MHAFHDPAGVGKFFGVSFGTVALREPLHEAASASVGSRFFDKVLGVFLGGVSLRRGFDVWFRKLSFNAVVAVFEVLAVCGLLCVPLAFVSLGSYFLLPRFDSVPFRVPCLRALGVGAELAAPLFFLPRGRFLWPSFSVAELSLSPLLETIFPL